MRFAGQPAAPTRFIAVGSGTINDLTKYSSALDGKPYAVFATAPSMNGYTSLTASISQHGHKLTLPAQAPAGAFFDLAVLAAAPKRMIRAGLGDSVCRATAQTDWLMSHLLLDTPYRQLPFDLLTDEEPLLLEMASDLVAGSIEAMRVLVRTLILSGLGTAIFGSSAPASQAEHLVSHYIDMLAPGHAAARLPRRAGRRDDTVDRATAGSAARRRRRCLMPDMVTEQDVIAISAPNSAARCGPNSPPSGSTPRKPTKLNHRISTGWSAISARLAQSFLSPARIEAGATRRRRADDARRYPSRPWLLRSRFAAWPRDPQSLHGARCDGRQRPAAAHVVDNLTRSIRWTSSSC